MQMDNYEFKGKEFVVKDANTRIFFCKNHNWPSGKHVLARICQVNIPGSCLIGLNPENHLHGMQALPVRPGLPEVLLISTKIQSYGNPGPSNCSHSFSSCPRPLLKRQVEGHPVAQPHRDLLYPGHHRRKPPFPPFG